MKQEYTILCQRIASLSLDPYLLTNTTLSRITEIERLLTDAAASDHAEAVFRSLCVETTEQLGRKKAEALSAEAKRKTLLLNAYNSVLQNTSRLLSDDLIQGTTTVRFTHPKEELRELKKEMRSLTSVCESVRSDLIARCGLEKPSSASSAYRKEILALRIASTLCEERLPSTNRNEILNELSSTVKEFEALESSDKQLREVGLQIAVELLTPFLERVSAMCLEVYATHHFLNEVQALQLQLRQTIMPLLKT